MDFRDMYCAWCGLKAGPVEDCFPCPRFLRFGLGEDVVLDAAAFCGKCRNNGTGELSVFCGTNRKLQRESDEPFDCYKFSLDKTGDEIRKTHVVTVFLTHRGKVCLVKRSSRVGTFQGLWSGISGYLQGDPLEHYKVELKEETSLEPSDYTLLRQADTVVIRDEGHSCLWCVHPFLCEIHDPPRVTLDWENTELRWVEPEEMGEMQTVPGLRQVYERVSMLPVQADIAAFVLQLKADRESGARQLAFKALDFLARLVRSSNAASSTTLMSDLYHAGHEIGSARPSMAIIPTTMEFLLRDARAFTGFSIQEAKAQVMALIRRNIKEMDSALDLAVGHLDRVIPRGSTVVLHSYSSSLIHALPLLRQKQCSLVVTESRPGLEGRTTARVAAEMGIPVRLIVDADAGHEIGQAAAVLMGVDTIEQDGSVINKAGSSLIAMAAHSLNISVYFIGEIRKICLASEGVDLEEYDPEEVWETPPKGVEVRNRLFDRTPPGCITGIILEKGVMEPGRIREIAGAMLPVGGA